MENLKRNDRRETVERI